MCACKGEFFRRLEIQVAAICCRIHAWRQTVGLGARADALHSTSRLSDWDSLGACRASYISSAQQSQSLQLSAVSAESFFNAFWYCSFTQATLSFSSSAMASMLQRKDTANEGSHAGRHCDLP